MYLYSHNENSEGAKALAAALKIKRIRHEGSSFVGGSNKTVINWGSRDLPPEVRKCRVLNNEEALNAVVNKLSFFRLCSNAPADRRPRTPRWTTDSKEAISWVTDKKEVVARRVLNGSSGEGIQFMSFDKKDSFVEAPLYTEYVKKKDEYRVHFVNGQIIDYQRKALRSGTNPDKIDWRIRNLDGGFVFIRHNVTGDVIKLPTDVTTQAQKAIDVSGIDFGAIDLIYNEKEGQAYVLEVNTAPGLQGETVESYANAFKRAFS